MTRGHVLVVAAVLIGGTFGASCSSSSGGSSSGGSSSSSSSASSSSSSSASTSSGTSSASTSSTSSTSSSGTSSASTSSTSSSSSSGAPACTATWSNGFPGATGGAVMSLTATAPGRVVIAGTFTGTVSFGGASLVQQGGAANLFVAAFDCSGAPLWSKSFGTGTASGTPYERVYGIAGAGDGSVVLTGQFQGQLDFGSGPLVSGGLADGFIAKLDAAGNPVFAMSFGAQGDAMAAGEGVALDEKGDVYVTGFAPGSQSFGGADSVGVDGQDNQFVVELDPLGHPIWGNAFGEPGPSASLALDPSDNVVLAGSGIDGTLNFGGGLIPSDSMYAAKLTSNGSFAWSTSWSHGSGTVASVTTGPNGEIAFSGAYFGDAPVFGGSALPWAPNGAAYVAKLTSSGAVVFGASSGPDDAPTDTIPTGTGVALSASGDVYMVGGFAGGFDFGGGVVSTGAIQNAFLAKYGPTGTLSWVHTYNATGVSYGGALGFDASDALYIAGVYGPSTKLDLGNGALPHFTATNESAVFLGRLAP